MESKAVFPIRDVYDSMQKGQEPVSSQLGVPANSKGCGGIIDISLMIPESITLFVAPLGCARHITTHSWQRTGRVFALALEEADVVTGNHIKVMEDAVKEIYEFCEKKPKLVMLCGSCIDRLMASDFEMVSYDLKKEIPAEIRVIWMDPVIGRKEHPQVRCWDQVYSYWNHAERKNTVNVIGRLSPLSKESEVRKLLAESGIEAVRHMADCQTLEEYKDMGSAKLNIVGSSLGVKAARHLERAYGIPYLMCRPTFSPEIVHKMYQDIGTMLGGAIDDSTYYERTKREVEKFKEKYQERTIKAAVGEAYAGHNDAFAIAEDIAKLGIQVEWIYSDGKLKGKEEQIRWLAQHQPQAKVLFLCHPSSREVLVNPPEVDFAWGMCEKWFERRKENHWIDVEKRPIDCDYTSICWFLGRVEEEVEKNA